MTATLTQPPDIELYLVDEIGKMECLSERFVAAMRRTEVKHRADCELWKLTRANRDTMPEQLLGWMKQ